MRALRALPPVAPAMDTARAEACTAAMTRVTVFAVLLVVLAAPAWAGWDEGVAAYKRGDHATALREFRVLAEQGDTNAQYNLGNMYYNGRGVTRDYVRAHMWFNLAAAGSPPGEGRDTGAKNRDIVAKLMTPAQIAEAQRLAIAEAQRLARERKPRRK